jgi:hypothetical protein
MEDGLVYKSFLGSAERHANLQTWERFSSDILVGALMDPSRPTAGAQILVTRFVRQEEELYTGQFAALLTRVATLAADGVVHGDLRRANVLLYNHETTREPCALLIDYDFAGDHEKKEYPRGLHLEIDDGERYRGSVNPVTQRSSKMFCHHDVYAVGAVLHLYRPQASAGCSRWDSVVHRLMGVRGQETPTECVILLEGAADDLRAMGVIALELRPDRNLTSGGTGSLTREPRRT